MTRYDLQKTFNYRLLLCLCVVKFMRFIEIIPMDKVDFNYMLPDDISFFVHCIGNGYRDDLVELMVINMTAQITVRDSQN